MDLSPHAHVPHPDQRCQHTLRKRMRPHQTPQVLQAQDLRQMEQKDLLQQESTKSAETIFS